MFFEFDIMRHLSLVHDALPKMRRHAEAVWSTGAAIGPQERGLSCFMTGRRAVMASKQADIPDGHHVTGTLPRIVQVKGKN
jgi:hypothetical protein